MLKQALILCGGKGERLKPITKKIPKPLAIINNKPILGHQIDYLINQGIKELILATGYKSELIEEYILSNYNNIGNKININFSDSGDVDIMQRIIDCKNKLKSEFLICYGDTLANINIHKLYKFYYKHGSSVTVTSYQIQSQFGTLDINANNQVINFLEKPVLDVWINIGFFIFNKRFIEATSKNFAEFISNLASSGHLFSYRHQGLHITVNTLSELEEAERNIKNFK